MYLSNKTGRDEGLDAIAGLLIVYMIFGHCCQIADARDFLFYKTSNKFLFFFMAWFYWKAGMFHRNNSLKESMEYSFQRLLKPFIVFTIIAHIFQCIYYIFIGDYNWIHYILSPIKQLLLHGGISWNAPLWFLPSLFIVKNIFNLWVTKYSPIYLLTIFFIALSTSREYEIEPIIIQSIALGCFFYTCGYLLKDTSISLSIISLCFAVYIYSIFNPSMVDFRTNSSKGCIIYILWTINSICAIILYNGLRKILINTLFSKTLIFIGRFSMFYYCSHWILIKILESFIEICKINISSIQKVYLYVLACCIILPLIHYCFTSKLKKLGL